MKELSLHLLDVIENSIKANASLIELDIREDSLKDHLHFRIIDDGRGMEPEFVERVLDPFTTTRTTRKVGLGLSLFKAAAEQTGGGLTIASEVGKGTIVECWFGLSSIDRAPLGKMDDTLILLISGYPDIDFLYRHETDSGSMTFDTRFFREALEDVPLNHVEVLKFLRKEFCEHFNQLHSKA